MACAISGEWSAKKRVCEFQMRQFFMGLSEGAVFSRNAECTTVRRFAGYGLRSVLIARNELRFEGAAHAFTDAEEIAGFEGMCFHGFDGEG
jgi:hypothetical protein